MKKYDDAEQKKQYEFLKKKLTFDGEKILHTTQILEYAYTKYAHRTAIIYKNQEITYAQLYSMVKAYASVLSDYKVQKKDRVIICFENNPAFYVAYYAVWSIGAVVIPVNTFLSSYELLHIITDAKPSLIITSNDRVDHFKKNGALKVSITTLPEVPNIEINQNITIQKSVMHDEQEMTALLYTSGTTGAAKGVMLSSKNIMTNVLQSLSRLQLDTTHRVFAVLPLFHVFAQNTCVWASFCAGATVILVPKISRKAITRALTQKPTIFLGVPALYGLLCVLRIASLDSVLLFISGGDALPDKIRTYFSLLYHRKICNGYGLTETAPVIAVDLDDVISPVGCVGKPVYGVICSIRDAKRNEVAQGKIGQLWVKGDNVMLGYYNAFEETKKVLQDGWFNTGDRMYKNHAGKLIIVGREKDIIIHKGLNIYPQEIENVLLSHESVIRVAVIGKKDENEEEFPIAFVQLLQEKKEIEKELYALCKQKLAAYKIPRKFFYQTDSLPLTATNKVDKKVLRKKYST